MGEVNFTFNHNLTIAWPTLLDAREKVDFLFPTAEIDTLINNASYTQTIGCFNRAQNESCINACGNVSEIFSSWPNFYTCSWYPALSEALNDSSLNASQVQALNDKGISSNGSNSPSIVSTSIASCLSDYCQSSPDCMDIDTHESCSFDNLISSNGSSNELNRTGAIICLRDSVCGSTASVNPDIGGLGVILSSLIQYSLSIGACILHLTFELLYKIKKWYHKRKGKTETSIKLIAKAKKVRTEHLDALTSAVVEFHKSQCFFAATLQIASLIVLPTFGNFGVEAHTRDSLLLRLTAANAYSPIVLTLAHIELLGGRSSKYILLLSTLTYALGTAAYFVTFPYKEGDLLWLDYDNPTTPVLSCNNFAPFAPCYYRNDFYFTGLWKEDSGLFYGSSTKGAGWTVWIIASGIMLYRLGFAFITEALDLSPVTKALKSCWSHIRQDSLRLMTSFRYTARLLSVFQRSAVFLILQNLSHEAIELSKKPQSWLYIQMFFGVLALILQLASMIPVFRLSSNIIDTHMSFGQIVAVGIWIPVLLEYGYLEINGAEDGNKYRLKAPLVVAKGPVPVASGAVQGTPIVTASGTSSLASTASSPSSASVHTSNSTPATTSMPIPPPTRVPPSPPAPSTSNIAQT